MVHRDDNTHLVVQRQRTSLIVPPPPPLVSESLVVHRRHLSQRRASSSSSLAALFFYLVSATHTAIIGTTICKVMTLPTTAMVQAFRISGSTTSRSLPPRKLFNIGRRRPTTNPMTTLSSSSSRLFSSTLERSTTASATAAFRSHSPGSPAMTTTTMSSGRDPTSSVRNSSSSSSSSSVVELQYMEFGPSSVDDTTRHSKSRSKPPALFLHGLLGNKRNFATIGTSLSQQIQSSRRLIGLDLRNHGDNHHDWREDMTYESMAHDVIHFCDVHGLEQVELIGHSVGGKVAQTVALLQPERVKGLVVVDIAPVRYTPDEPHWKAVEEIIDALLSVSLPSADRTPLTKRDVDVLLRSCIPDPALRAFCLTNFQSGSWKIPLSTIRNQLHHLAGFDVSSKIGNTSASSSTPQFTGDAFFIHGGQSKFVRHSHLESISQYFPNHMLTTIRGAGHWVHAEAPEDTTALLLRFLDR